MISRPEKISRTTTRTHDASRCTSTMRTPSWIKTMSCCRPNGASFLKHYFLLSYGTEKRFYLFIGLSIVHVLHLKNKGDHIREHDMHMHHPPGFPHRTHRTHACVRGGTVIMSRFQKGPDSGVALISDGNPNRFRITVSFRGTPSVPELGSEVLKTYQD